MTDKISEKVADMFQPLKNVCLKGYTMIIPSVSVGNVGQLCVDLLIQTLECEKAGYIWHPAILPVVGVDPYKTSSSALALSAEVYFSETQKVALLQLRSSIVKKLRKPFLKDFMKWIKSQGMAQVVILTGSSNEERIDDQIVSEPFRYLLPEETCPKLAETFSALGWIALERRHHFPALSKLESLELDSRSVGQVVIPGGGFAKHLLGVCSENQIACAALIKFCSEGDNIPDALVMVTKLNEWLKLVKQDSSGVPRWVFPPSWNHLFGSPPPKQLY